MDEDLGRAWEQAAADLGIAVRRHGDAVVVEQFGSPTGTLCGISKSGDDPQGLSRAAAREGMYLSFLAPVHLAYDRDLFIDTLNDWGWAGQGEPPSWYTGKPWSD